MTKEKCEDCGKVLIANAYGILYCPRCQKGYEEDFNEMVESTNGGYY